MPEDDSFLDGLEAAAELMNDAEIPTQGRYFYCVYCDRPLPIRGGVVVHDNIYHPENYDFNEEKVEH
jgi:hypothetical protein